MSDKKEDAGAYGTRHVMEEKMRAAEQGVFEAKSGAAPENKMVDGAPEVKALSRQNKAELIATAAAEGVALDDGDTNAEIIEKIEKARG